MKRPAVFFDRDNTLIVSDGYLGDPAKVVLVEGAADAVAQARRLGYAVVVVSNQSGVARGMFSEEDVTAVNARMEELLAAENAAAVIDRHEFCPIHPEGTVDVYSRESDRRKPKPGMILSAAEKLALDLSRSWVVGDAPRDIEAGRAAGCRTILFHDASLNPSPAAMESATVAPDYTVTTLGEAMEYIGRNPPTEGGHAAPPHAAEPQATYSASVAPVAEAPEASAPHEGSFVSTAPAPRVPKVAIGSKYVPLLVRGPGPLTRRAKMPMNAPPPAAPPSAPRTKRPLNPSNPGTRPPLLPPSAAAIASKRCSSRSPWTCDGSTRTVTAISPSPSSWRASCRCSSWRSSSSPILSASTRHSRSTCCWRSCCRQ
jgi:D-glycero-D-manno-heptose 1,7-bisphosphate phosphatase